MQAEATAPRRYVEGDVPSWRQLDYAVGLLCTLADVERPAGKRAMRSWIGELKAMSEAKSDDGCPF